MREQVLSNAPINVKPAAGQGRGRVCRDRAASFRVGGLKREGNFFGGGGRGVHACGFLFNFS